MEQTPFRAGIGCANLVSLIAGFGAGLHYGLAKSKGIEVDESQRNAWLYAPTIVSGVLGFIGGNDLASDPRAMAEIKQMAGTPPPGAEGCASGCGVISSTIGLAAVTALGTYIGYVIGS